MPKRRRAWKANPAKSVVDIMVVEPIQGSSQAVVIEHVGGDPFSQQVLDGFVLKILRHQIELSIVEPQPIEDHRNGCRSYTHTSMLFPCLHI